jgi:hypothetical protein
MLASDPRPDAHFAIFPPERAGRHRPSRRSSPRHSAFRLSWNPATLAAAAGWDAIHPEDAGSRQVLSLAAPNQ